MIMKLVDFLEACNLPINRGSYKVHLATDPSSTDSPLTPFLLEDSRRGKNIKQRETFNAQ